MARFLAWAFACAIATSARRHVATVTARAVAALPSHTANPSRTPRSSSDFAARDAPSRAAAAATDAADARRLPPSATAAAIAASTACP